MWHVKDCFCLVCLWVQEIFLGPSLCVTGFLAEMAGLSVIKGWATKNELSWFCCHRSDQSDDISMTCNHCVGLSVPALPLSAGLLAVSHASYLLISTYSSCISLYPYLIAHCVLSALLSTGYGPHLVICLAQLGLKALALAWPEVALAFSTSGPSQSHHSWLGPSCSFCQRK